MIYLPLVISHRKFFVIWSFSDLVILKFNHLVAGVTLSIIVLFSCIYRFPIVMHFAKIRRYFYVHCIYKAKLPQYSPSILDSVRHTEGKKGGHEYFD